MNGRSTLAQVRQWAYSRGWDVPPRGRLPLALIDAYNEAHPDVPCVVSRAFVIGSDITPEQRRERSRRAARARWGGQS